MTFARLMLAVLAVQATGTEFADGPVVLAGYAVLGALSLLAIILTDLCAGHATTKVSASVRRRKS
jgi:hypothetical protein